MDSNGETVLNCDCEADYNFRVWKYTPPLSDTLSEPSEEEIVLSEGLDIIMDPNILFTSTRVNIFESKKMPLSLKQISILSTLMPNFFFNYSNIVNKIYDTFLCVFFFVDLSGFTYLSEAYRKKGASGIFRLTATLNTVFSKLVAAIYLHGGDVYKFSGDAFLAIWTPSKRCHLATVIHQALRCALFIQDNYGTFETDVDIILKMKISLSAGNVVFCSVGNDYSRRVLMVGQAVIDISRAQNYCQPGEIVITQSTWQLLSPSDFIFELLCDGKFIRIIKQIRYMGIAVPHQIKRLRTAMEEENAFTLGEFEILNGKGRNMPDMSNRESQTSALRLFVIPPVVQQIDADMSLDYLTQMRELTIMFVNIIPMKVLSTDLVNIVDKCYSIIYDVVWEAGGFVDSVSLFDKDIMLVTIFGFRGFHHEESEVASCLEGGFDVLESCQAIEGVLDVAVAVTSGVSYCGIVGHPLRQSFTVIGPVVNKAARLMVAYPGVVSCDYASYLKAIQENVSQFSFSELPPKTLKGISSDEIFYQYTAQRKKIFFAKIKSGIYPLMGRTEEVNIFLQQLNQFGKPNANECSILIEGEILIGKSRLLDEMAIHAFQLGHMPTLLSLRSTHASTPFASAQYIINELLEISNSTSPKIIEKEVLRILDSSVKTEDLPLINKMICNCKLNPLFNKDEIIPLRMKKLFNSILSLGSNSPIIIIDDVDYCDFASWELLLFAVEQKIKLFIMSRSDASTFTIRKTYREIPHNLSNHLHLLILGSLSFEEICSLICQHFDVKAVHFDALKFLESKGRGIPGWSLTLLYMLVEDHFVAVEQIDLKNVARKHFCLPSKMHLTTFTIDMPLLKIRTLPLDESCVVLFDANFQYIDHLSTLHFVKLKSEEALLFHYKQSISSSDAEDAITNLSLKTEDQLQDINLISEMKKNVIVQKPILQDIFDLQLSFLGHDQAVPLQFIVSITDVQIEEAVEFFVDLKEKQFGNNFDGKDSPRKSTVVLSSNLTRSPEESNSIFEKKIILPASKLVTIKRESPGTIASKVSAEVETEDTINALIITQSLDLVESHENYISVMSIFDSLRPFDQFLLKCASAIGQQFSRGLLQTVMLYPNENFMNLGIKRMFDANIIKCAEAVSKKSKKMCICPRQESASTENIPIASYALCRNMTFSHSGLRHTLSNLLTPQQRVEFQERIVHFLENESGLCQRCQELRNLDKDMESEGTGRRHFVLSQIEKIPDLTDCNCHEITNRITDDLIQHTESAGMHLKNLVYTLRKSKLAILGGDDETARRCVTKALQILADNEEEKINLRLQTADLSIYKGRTEYLLGLIEFEVKQYDHSKEHLLNCLNLFGIPFRTRYATITKWVRPLVRTLLKLSQWFQLWESSLEDDVIGEAGQAFCLLANIFMLTDKCHKALAASLSSISVLYSRPQLAADLACAFSTLLDVSKFMKKINIAQDFLPLVTKRCGLLFTNVSVQSSVALGRLASSIFYLGYYAGTNLAQSRFIHISDLLTLTQKIPGMRHTRVHLLVDYIIVLTYAADISTSVACIKSMRNIIGTAKAWYYISCMNFLLDTGLQIERPSVLVDVVLLWVWLLRHHETHQAEKCFQWENLQDIINLSNSVTIIGQAISLKMLEGMILYAATLAPSFPRFRSTRLLIVKSFRKFSMIKSWHLGQAQIRFNFLWALYNRLVLKRPNEAIVALNVAEKNAKKLNTPMFISWFAINKEHWIGQSTKKKVRRRGYLDDYPRADDWTGGDDSWPMLLHIYD